MDHIKFLSFIPISFSHYRHLTKVTFFLAHNEGKWGGGSTVRSFLTLTLVKVSGHFIYLPLCLNSRIGALRIRQKPLAFA
jgi:hypothetical protein